MGILIGVIAVLLVGYIIGHLFGRESIPAKFFRVLFTIFRKLWGLALLLLLGGLALGFFGII